MPPQTSPRKDRALALVLAGKASPKTPVKTVGLASLAAQNIRKRVRHERAREEEQRVAAEEEQRLRTATKKSQVEERKRLSVALTRPARRQLALELPPAARLPRQRPRPRTTDPPRRSTATSQGQGPSRLQERKRADERVVGALMAERRAAVRAG
jgi:hypothetical protein